MDALSDYRLEAGVSTAYTTSAGNTALFVSGPTKCLVWATTDAYVAVGVSSIVASVASIPLPAYTPVILDVPQVSSITNWRASAIQMSANGTLYAKPVK